ncbi:MAG: globin [Proteobacteria bacterium]|nr:globin [Pseudomonadota bacterium]
MRIDEDTLNIFNNSLNRCQSNPQFLSLFYQKFALLNSDIREKFFNTDMEQQKIVLHASIQMIMLASQGNKAAIDYLDSIAKLHSKAELDIRPELYDIWLDTLMETVSIIDTNYDKKIDNAWKKVMNYGIEYMKSQYDYDKKLN